MTASKHKLTGKTIAFFRSYDPNSLTIKPRHIIAFTIVAPLSFLLGCITRLYMVSDATSFVSGGSNQSSGMAGLGTKPINLPPLELVRKSFPTTTYTSEIFPTATVATLTCTTVHLETDIEQDSNVDQMFSSGNSLDDDSSDDDSDDEEESKDNTCNSDESVNKPYGQHLVSL